MRRKILQDYANKVCEIFTGWRLAVQEDIPRLIELGAGELVVDLLDGTVTVDGASIAPLGIAAELTAWLQQRLLTDEVPRSGIESARLVVRFSAAERTTRRGTFVRDQVRLPKPDHDRREGVRGSEGHRRDLVEVLP